ncbi:phage tail protein [Methylocystis sp. WRRC1]|uniref:phage tail protein n=1 Tax=unclassified Methylocystis TaxID=2625913 RepID=UPI0001F86A97|nr:MULTISPECIES: phage tail protein [unclassified Methylocystis]MCC3246136.1 phage tail protein [Methylocystis sp. WRRC1]
MSDEPDDLLPGNATAWEQAQSKTSARILDTDTAVIRRERDPARCDAAFLPFLAAERSVHQYAGGLAAKRARTAESFDDHLAYGTPAKLEEEIARDTGQEVRIVEYFEDRELEWPDIIVESLVYPGEEPPNLDAVMRSVMRRKNVRDWPAKVRPHYRNSNGNLFHGSASFFSVRIRTVEPRSRNLFHGAGARFLPQIRINPQ